jgi:hypothetical protein
MARDHEPVLDRVEGELSEAPMHGADDNRLT